MKHGKFLFTVTALSLTGSLGLTVAAMLLSPSDPARAEQREQVVHRQAPPTGFAKGPRIFQLIASGQSYTFGRESVVTTFGRGVWRTLVVQALALPAGWAIGSALGFVLGLSRRRWWSTVGIAILLISVLVPAPVKAATARLLFLETGWFSIGANESGYGAFLPAVFTLVVLAVPAIAIHQAVLTEQSLRQNYVVFARGIRLSWKTNLWLIATGSAAFWRSQVALLLVSLVEGSLLVEEVFQVKGIGRSAYQAAMRCDAALLLLIVAVSCVLVDVGVLGSVRSDEKSNSKEQ